MYQFHNNNPKYCINVLNSSEAGLMQDEARKRNYKHGLNELPKKKPRSKISTFLSQFQNPLAIILMIAGVLSLVLYEFVDTIVIFAALILNSIIGFFQENKASNAILSLRKLVERKALVIRNGKEMQIDSNLLTIGDVILIKEGNWIPADSRIIYSSNLQINESSLTGESIPARKNNEKVLKGAPLAERTCMLYAGTVVVSGNGRAIITSIGSNTEIGKIAKLVSESREEKTPLQIRLESFSKILGAFFSIICLIIVIVGLYQGRGFFEMIETGVAVGVASIPEGLTISVTFILALGMQSILKRKALTRKLVAAETLGSITTICTDKTGTLTKGKMHVAHIIIGEDEFNLDMPGSRQDPKEAKAVSLALQIGMMCNDAIINKPQDELSEWKIVGSPTDSALVSAAIQSGLRKDELLKMQPQVAELPFSSDYKYMISLHKDNEGYILYEKGAPEILLSKSDKFHHNGQIIILTEEHRKKLLNTYESLTDKGLRVIAVALRKYKSSKEINRNNVDLHEIDKNLSFIGFIAIKDPLRPEAKETIKTCVSAGIRPVIITGDHKLTAKAIAEEIGLKINHSNILSGNELDKISDDDFLKEVKKVTVYARVNPKHKLRIVKALQSNGEVVAMTGDGINDSPAIKVADIGIALGNGTDIAKETSDMVLLDSNFKTIIESIKEGRIIFKKIRRVITYLISDSFTEVVLIIGSIIFNLPLAIIPVQILWINIVNDGLPHFSLAFEKNSNDVMKEKPLLKKEPILNSEMKTIILVVGMITNIFIFLIYVFLYNFSEYSIELIRTVLFATLGIKSLVSIFSIRNLEKPIWKINLFSNPYLILAVAGSVLVLILGIYLPIFQTFLSTVSIGINAWLLISLIAVINLGLIEIAKILHKKN